MTSRAILSRHRAYANSNKNLNLIIFYPHFKPGNINIGWAARRLAAAEVKAAAMARTFNFIAMQLTGPILTVKGQRVAVMRAKIFNGIISAADIKDGDPTTLKAKDLAMAGRHLAARAKRQPISHDLSNPFPAFATFPLAIGADDQGLQRQQSAFDAVDAQRQADAVQKPLLVDLTRFRQGHTQNFLTEH